MEKKLTPYQRLRFAITGEKPDVLPAAPVYLLLFLDDFQREFFYQLYWRLLDKRTRIPVDHDQNVQFQAEAIYNSYGIFKARPDWIEINKGSSRAWADKTDIVKIDNALYYEDRQTGNQLHLKDAPIYGDPNTQFESLSSMDLWNSPVQITSQSDIEDLGPIDTPQELLETGHWDLAKRVVADYGNEYFITVTLDPPFSDLYGLLGFKDMMEYQHDHPDLLHAILERTLIQNTSILEAWADAGLHGIFAEETFTGADIISPDSYDRYVFAYNKPYFESIRSLGLLSIHYVCGDVLPRLDRIVELGVDAVAVEESKKNFKIDIDEVIERINGRCAVFGNIDAVQFGQNTPLEDMATEVERQAQAGQKAEGFVISTGSPFPLDTNPRLIDTLVSTAHNNNI